MTNTEFEAMLADASKRIEGDIIWTEDEDHSPALEFRAVVQSDAGYPLVVRGWLNRLTGKLSFTLLHRSEGRVLALDLGSDHHNPSCEMVGEKHKHRWSETLKDRDAYVPADVTSGVDDPVETWRQFCAEANIVHSGALLPAPPQQEELPL